MPSIIRTIDQIARQKQRSVLFLEFKDCCIDASFGRARTDPDECAIRKTIIAWLDKQGFGWEPCGRFTTKWILLEGYEGHIYLDVVFDQNDPVYQKLADYLEFPDGISRWDGVAFCYVTLKDAMKNAYQDEPGVFEDF